jgi:hypothetical protein
MGRSTKSMRKIRAAEKRLNDPEDYGKLKGYPNFKEELQKTIFWLKQMRHRKEPSNGITN